MLLPSKHLLTSVKFSFCTDNLPRVSLFLLFFNIQFTNRRAYPPVHTHVYHWQSDCSFAWVFSLSGLELAGTSLRVQESKTPRSGWAPQEKVTLKREAGRCFCCLPPGGSTGQGGCQDPSLPILLEHASRAIMVIVAVPGGVPGGLSTPESSSTACAARENENKGHGRVCLSFSGSLPPPRACQCCDACGLTVF